MKEKFIYVFDRETRDKLIKNGYSLIKTDEKQSIYVFENNETGNIKCFEELSDSENPDTLGSRCLFSSVLTL